MRLRHSTAACNLSSVKQDGLQASKSKGKLKVVWLHSAGRSAWAVLHVRKRHKVKVEDVVTIELTVPRAWLKKSGRTGLWYCPLDIPPEQFLRVIGVDELSMSPITGAMAE